MSENRVVVVGGGIVGLAVAHGLLCGEGRVVLAERGRTAGESTRAAARKLTALDKAVTDVPVACTELDITQRSPGCFNA